MGTHMRCSWSICSALGAELYPGVHAYNYDSSPFGTTFCTIVEDHMRLPALVELLEALSKMREIQASQLQLHGARTWELL